MAGFKVTAEVIQERHDSLLSRAADAAKGYTSLDCVLYGEADEQLDRLSMHVSDGDVVLDSLAILSLNTERILYQGRGRVYARSRDSDVALDKGEAIHDVYPFKCNFESDTGDPRDTTFVQGSMKIDSDSFPDDGQG